MQPAATHKNPARLRVLLVGQTGSGAAALTSWLIEQENLVVCSPAGGDIASLALAAQFRPQAVLLDAHGQAVTLPALIARFAALAARPAVFVLTHEPSAALRRRCREAHADAVFDKTAELEALRTALASLQISHPAEHA